MKVKTKHLKKAVSLLFYFKWRLLSQLFPIFSLHLLLINSDSQLLLLFLLFSIYFHSVAFKRNFYLSTFFTSMREHENLLKTLRFFHRNGYQSKVHEQKKDDSDVQYPLFYRLFLLGTPQNRTSSDDERKKTRVNCLPSKSR